jgi:hypothetical protein
VNALSYRPRYAIDVSYANDVFYFEIIGVFLVRAVGIEPTLLSERDFESLLSQVYIYLTICNTYIYIIANALVC